MVERYNGVEADPDGVYVMLEDYERLTQLNDLLRWDKKTLTKQKERLTTELAAETEVRNAVSRHSTRQDEEIERLKHKVEEPNWHDYVETTRNWLIKYPSDIFTGASGDSGPVFVVAIRAALAELDAVSTDRGLPGADKCLNDWHRMKFVADAICPDCQMTVDEVNAELRQRREVADNIASRIAQGQRERKPL